MYSVNPKRYKLDMIGGMKYLNTICTSKENCFMKINVGASNMNIGRPVMPISNA